MYTLVLLPHRGSYPYSARARLSRCGRERELSVGQRGKEDWETEQDLGLWDVERSLSWLREHETSSPPPLKPSDASLITKALGSAFIVHTQKQIKGMEISWGKGTFLQICMSLSRLEFRGLVFLLYSLICIEVSSTKPLAEPTSVSGKTTAPRDGTACIPDLIIVMSVASWILYVF